MVLSHLQINPEFLDPNDDREFINYLKNLEAANEFDDLEDWLDDIDLVMESLIHPNKIEELWHISKAKRMWDDFQSHQQREQQHPQQTTVPHNQRAAVQMEHASVQVAPRTREGLPPPEPRYHPFGLRNLATISREATISKIPTKSGKDLDSLHPIGHE